MKDQIAQESGGVKAQERVSEALREMRSVKEELGRWRQCMSSERTDLAFSMLRHTTETPGPSPEQQESSSPAPPVADLAAKYEKRFFFKQHQNLAACLRTCVSTASS